MFSPKEEFQTVELHLEHVKDTIKEKFGSLEDEVFKRLHVTREYLEAELGTVRSDLEGFRQRLRALESNMSDGLQTAFDRIARLENKTGIPTPVNTPPNASQAQSSDGD